MMSCMFGFSVQDICGGNLGENIFEVGDFGSGVVNFLFVNFGIVLGYFYFIFFLFNDGFYIIINYIVLWLFWDSWFFIGDNSIDFNGYMMVVNVSFEEGVFYEQQVDGLCENILYEFLVDMINLIWLFVLDYICFNVLFLIDGEVWYIIGVLL